MKELIYIHASSSYHASHFFNTQLSYFTYDGLSGEKPVLVDPDVSFREGVAPNGSSTFCPRLLLFDFKSDSSLPLPICLRLLNLQSDRFGSLSYINALNAVEEDGAADSTWTGPVTEHRQEPIPQSTYHARLDAGEDDEGDDDPGVDMDEAKDEDEGGSVLDLTPSIRFWSDYSRVYHHPRGLHRIPDPVEWEGEIGWIQGVERFKSYDAEQAVLEDSFRLFAEECDLLQGVQLNFDAPSFGSFTASLLSQLRDEYPKLPILSFCSLSRHDPAEVNLGHTPPCVGALNDAWTLHELAMLSTLIVPLQCPTTWRRGLWSEHLNADFTNVYHSSALQTVHIESATLPLRLKPSMSSSTDLASLCAQMNWRGNTPFAALFGAFPFPSSPSKLEGYSFDYSHPTSLHKDKGALPFAQRDVYRGLEATEKEAIKDWANKAPSELQEPFLTRNYIDIPYPIPSSHPQFFTQLSTTSRSLLSPTSKSVRSVPTYTSLRTTPRTGTLIRSYARLVQNIRKRGSVVVEELGVEKDALADIEEQLWAWDGGYGGEDEDGNLEGDEAWGEDERDGS